MGFQIAYLAPELTKKYGLALNVIAGVIYVLSDKGTREIIASEPFLSERTGLSVRMISKAKGILSKEGFLKTRTFNKGLTRVTTLIPTSKLVEVFNLPDHAQHALSITHNVHDRTSTACVTITHGVRDPSRTECTNDHAQHACKNNKENNTGNNVESNSGDAREKNDNSDNAPALNDIPLPDDSDFYETEENKEPEPDLNDLYGTECTYNAQEPANLPQTTNYTSNTNNTPSMQSSNEIEGVRRQLTIPSSADELIPLIEKFKAAHKAEKVFDDLDVRFYAGKIFDYYAGADGVWRDNKGNEVPPYRIFNKISSWIVNDQMNGKLHRIISSGTMTSADLSKAMDEIAEKNKREKLALMQKFGIKPPPIDVSCEEVENDENNNEPKLLEAK